MSYGNYFFRRIRNGFNRLRLKNKDFTLFSSNCNGGCICHDLGLPFRSPFVNLWLCASDYIAFLTAPEDYLSKPLDFIQDAPEGYPVAKIGDITLYFTHYKTPQQAEEAWQRRKQRICWDNLFVMMSDQDGCTDEILKRFEALPYKNKVIFTHVPRPDIRCAAYIPGFEDASEVGNCDAFMDSYSGRKYFDAFDYVSWFNDGK